MSEDKKKQVSRRQFLNYTLTGVGGFMAAGMLSPMLRFAIDPVLKAQGGGDFVAVVEVDKITTEPQRFDFTIEQVDAWYESEVTKSAWVFKQEDGSILALSPICTHLGCVVSWEGSENHPERFYCPCHDGLYYKDGVNVPNTPPTEPLHVYDYKIQDGMLYLGKAKPREEA
ncbi:menaquinol-cytochrome c reductase iron-sulfur subunit [Melghiribacillus thermohalophilus]|uniref:Menaquinol:cytochrome c reductase iron-sulfur subunit n=1 Tax=Melghiribacillus thermohalophilus TaxID=1324956 RepID=A0A4V2V2L0_9BACI|nr:ubiquinol-cytochrome c reductase iron-sulfur subunit [Melghiribacillus thermohalophilus]TCT25565.1 menaquinol-cytochrome c reductase iron-sulfur subunit [Melghiribacillus thermohalophilus]